METRRVRAGWVGLGCIFLSLALASATFGKKTPPAEPIDINTATVKELEELPGVGPTTAKAIVEFRTKSGRFHRVNDLLVIRGISEAKLKKNAPLYHYRDATAQSHNPREGRYRR
jgi:competence protein ComEA